MTICLQNQPGRLSEAEELMVPKLRDREHLRGFKLVKLDPRDLHGADKTFRLADSLYTLANVRVAQRNFEAALEGFTEAYTILRDQLGERHRLTANCCYCLAWIFNRQRKYNAAM